MTDDTAYLLALTVAMESATENGPLPLVLAWHKRLLDLRQAIQLLERRAEDRATRKMPKRVEVPDLGVVERQRGSNRKSWDHTALAATVTEPLIVDANGEVQPDRQQLVDDVLRTLLDAAALSYWRVGKLTELGIEVDQFCVTTPGRDTLRWVSVAEETAA